MLPDPPSSIPSRVQPRRTPSWYRVRVASTIGRAGAPVLTPPSLFPLKGQGGPACRAASNSTPRGLFGWRAPRVAHGAPKTRPRAAGRITVVDLSLAHPGGCREPRGAGQPELPGFAGLAPLPRKRAGGRPGASPGRGSSYRTAAVPAGFVRSTFPPLKVGYRQTSPPCRDRALPDPSRGPIPTAGSRRTASRRRRRDRC